MKLRAALLDLGNVIWDDGAIDSLAFHYIREMFRSHALELTDTDVADAVDEAVREWAPSVNDFVLARFARRAGIEARQALAEWEIVYAPAQSQTIARTALFPGVAAGLARMKGAGLRLAVATNYGPEVRVRLHALGVGPYIDVWGLAPELRVRKPEAAFFARVLERLEVAPGEAVMVGDRQDNDIAPAKAQGLHAVRLRHGLHREQRPRGTGDAPDFEAKDFEEAAAWIVEHAR